MTDTCRTYTVKAERRGLKITCDSMELSGDDTVYKALTGKDLTLNAVNFDTPVLNQLTFLLHDEFTTAEAAPLASPRTCEPGDGELTAVQLDGQLSIADGMLSMPAQSTPAWAGQGIYCGTAFERRAGLSMIELAYFSNGVAIRGQLRSTAGIGFNSTGSGIYRDSFGLQPSANGVTPRIGLTYLEGEQVLGIIARAAGAYYIVRNRLFWVDKSDTAANLYWSVTNYDSTVTMDYIRICDLPAPFNQTDGLALSVTAEPTDGVIVTGAGDGSIYFTWTPATNEVLNIRYRRVDDDNCMIVRCDQANGTIKIIRRWAGSETEIATANTTWTASTAYPLYVHYHEDRHWVGKIANATALNITNKICGYQFNKTGVKVDGFTAGANLETYPYYLSGTAATVWSQYSNPYYQSYRTQEVIDVADGGDITAAIATMRNGDILNLAANGTYTIDVAAKGIESLPHGFLGYRTEIRGNGATILGGTYGIDMYSVENFKISNLNFLDQTLYGIHLSSCRNFEITGCTIKSTVNAVYMGNTNFDKCKDYTVTDCIVGPTTTQYSACDGFEMYGECENGTFTNCEVNSAPAHGFEVWTGSSPNWLNSNIQFVGCYSHDNVRGFSCEGGAQTLEHENIVCTNCTASDNSQGDYAADDGAVLYRTNSPGTIYEATGGDVIDL